MPPPRSTTRPGASPAPSTTSPSPRSSPPTPPGRRSSTSPPPAPPSARSYQQNEHPADTMNSKPRQAPPGGLSAVAHTLTANDAATLTPSVAEHRGGQSGAITQVHQEVADLLGGPGTVRVRGHAEDVYVTGADLDHE